MDDQDIQAGILRSGVIRLINHGYPGNLFDKPYEQDAVHAIQDNLEILFRQRHDIDQNYTPAQLFQNLGLVDVDRFKQAFEAELILHANRLGQPYVAPGKIFFPPTHTHTHH